MPLSIFCPDQVLLSKGFPSGLRSGQKVPVRNSGVGGRFGYFLFFSVRGRGKGRRRPSRWRGGQFAIESRGGGRGLVSEEAGRGYRCREDVYREEGGT